MSIWYCRIELTECTNKIEQMLIDIPLLNWLYVLMALFFFPHVLRLPPPRVWISQRREKRSEAKSRVDEKRKIFTFRGLVSWYIHYITLQRHLQTNYRTHLPICQQRNKNNRLKKKILLHFSLNALVLSPSVSFQSTLVKSSLNRS